MIYKGQAGPLAYFPEYTVEADGSLVARNRWRGSRAAIYGLVKSLRTQGVRADAYPVDSAYWEVVSSGEFASGGDQSVQWKASTVILEQSVFQHPSATTEADGYGLGEYRRTVEDIVSGEVQASAADPFAQVLVRLLSRGAENFEREYLSLRRRAVMPARFATRMSLKATSFIFTDAQIGAVGSAAWFSLPSIAALQADSSLTPSFTQWGYRFHGQELDFEGSQRIQTVEFVLAPWSTDLYTLSAGPFSY